MASENSIETCISASITTTLVASIYSSERSHIRRERKQHGKFITEVGEASEKKQQELMAKREDFELYAKWPQYEKLLTSQLSFRSEQQPDSAGAQAPPEREAADVNILVPGCGRSKLSENLYDAGFKNITNLDFSEDVICDMLKRNERVRPEMKWLVMDLTMLQFSDETFDAIVDNGGLDSLMGTDSSLGRQYLDEVKRVLKAGGKYVYLTLAEHLVLDLLFPMFRFGWKMSLYAIGQKASLKVTILQTFMVVAKKESSPDVHDISSFLEESSSNQARVLDEVLRQEKEIHIKYTVPDMTYSIEDLCLGAIGI